VARQKSVRFGGSHLHRDSNEAVPSGTASYFVVDVVPIATPGLGDPEETGPPFATHSR